MSSFTPREIVSELDRYIVGQNDAKRAVAIALRNRWRRLQLSEGMREEVMPKNILMIGPTGIGKTEISRRLSKLAQAPFLKIEATKFTEVGYVGRDVEQIIRDLVEIAVKQSKEFHRKEVTARAELMVEDRVIDIMVGDSASDDTKQKFRKKFREGELDDKEVEIEVEDSTSSMPAIDIPGMPGAQMGMFNLGDLLGKSFNKPTKKKKLKVVDAVKVLLQEISDSLIDQEVVIKDALQSAEQNGIVFLDEIDKICARSERQGGDVSREGVQRDLLPLLEGTVVSTKHGLVKTDHILFIASGAFHVAKPSDLLPELQGRLPIRVELKALNKEDLKRILTEPEASLIKQYVELMKTEQVVLEFTEDAIDAIASIAEDVNSRVENIGARRLQTIMERILDEISFNASDHPGDIFKIDAKYVNDKVGDLVKDTDLSRFIL